MLAAYFIRVDTETVRCTREDRGSFQYFAAAVAQRLGCEDVRNGIVVHDGNETSRSGDDAGRGNSVRGDADHRSSGT